MSKSQYLSEAKRFDVAETGRRNSSTINSVLLCAENAPSTALQKLSISEREALHRQVEDALARERRRANVGAKTYDLSRHINLYLLAKSLTHLENQKGPVSGARMKTT